jgi:adenylate cyclase
MRLLPGLTLGDPRLTRPFRRLEDRERFLLGLRKAGVTD